MTSQNGRALKYPKAPGVAARYDIAEVTVWVWTRLGKLLIQINPSQKLLDGAYQTSKAHS